MNILIKLIVAFGVTVSACSISAVNLMKESFQMTKVNDHQVKMTEKKIHDIVSKVASGEINYQQANLLFSKIQAYNTLYIMTQNDYIIHQNALISHKLDEAKDLS